MADEASPMSDNEALNAIVGELEGVASILAARYDSISGDSTLVAVSDTSPINRGPVADAVKTVVTNGGANKVFVSFDAVLVAVVLPGETRELPMDGSASVQVTCATGQSSLIAIATFKKTV